MAAIPPTIKPLREVLDCRTEIQAADAKGHRLGEEAVLGKALEKALAPRTCWRGWGRGAGAPLVAVDLKVCLLDANGRPKRPAVWRDLLLPTSLAEAALQLAAEVRGALGGERDGRLAIEGADLSVWGPRKQIVGNVDYRASLLVRGAPGEVFPPPGGLGVPFVARLALSLKTTVDGHCFPRPSFTLALQGLRAVAPFLADAREQKTLAPPKAERFVWHEAPHSLAALAVWYERTGDQASLKDLAVAFWPLAAVCDATLTDATLLRAALAPAAEPPALHGGRRWFAALHRGVESLAPSLDGWHPPRAVQVQGKLDAELLLGNLPAAFGAAPPQPQVPEAPAPFPVSLQPQSLQPELPPPHPSAPQPLVLASQASQPDSPHSAALRQAAALATEASSAEQEVASLEEQLATLQQEVAAARRRAAALRAEEAEALTRAAALEVGGSAGQRERSRSPPVHGRGLCPRCNTVQNFVRKRQQNRDGVPYWMCKCEGCKLHGAPPGSTKTRRWTSIVAT